MNRFVMKEPIVNEVRHGFRETRAAGNHNVAVGQGNNPPAEPGAFSCEPLKAAIRGR